MGGEARKSEALLRPSKSEARPREGKARRVRLVMASKALPRLVMLTQ